MKLKILLLVTMSAMPLRIISIERPQSAHKKCVNKQMDKELDNLIHNIIKSDAQFFAFPKEIFDGSLMLARKYVKSESSRLSFLAAMQLGFLRGILEGDGHVEMVMRESLIFINERLKLSDLDGNLKKIYIYIKKLLETSIEPQLLQQVALSYLPHINYKLCDDLFSEVNGLVGAARLLAAQTNLK